MREIIFGSESATMVLLFLQTYGDGYGREIARTFGIRSNQVQNQLRKFENEGWFVSRPVGRTTVYSWNPRNPLVKPLRAFLQAVADALPDDDVQAYFRQRRRPRSRGKPS